MCARGYLSGSANNLATYFPYRPTKGAPMQHADRATAAVALLLYSGIILFGFALAAGVCDYIAKRRDRG